jgi:hypothetical protein
MKKLIPLMLVSLVTGCASKPANETLAVNTIEKSELVYIETEKIDKVVVKNAEAFKQFNKAILFATQFDKLRISEATDKRLAASWNDSTWKEMDKICQHMDDFAKKIFREGGEFVPVTQGGTDVLAIQFSLVDYTPYTKRYKDANSDTVGMQSNSSGIGQVTVRGVLANAKTGEMVAIIEDTIEINARTARYGNLATMSDGNSKAAQNFAWRTSFRRFLDNVHAELTRLKYAQVAGSL